MIRFKKRNEKKKKSELCRLMSPVDVKTKQNKEKQKTKQNKTKKKKTRQNNKKQNQTNKQINK